MLICCLPESLTIDQASLSRRSTVPTPNRDMCDIWALITCFPHTSLYVLVILSHSCFALCGHQLSPRIAITFSLLSSDKTFYMPHSSTFLIYSNTSRSSSYISHYPSCMCVLLYCFATRAHLCISFLLLPTTGRPLPSFWKAQVCYTKLKFQRFHVAHIECLEKIGWGEFLLVCFLYKINPNPRKMICCGKK